MAQDPDDRDEAPTASLPPSFEIHLEHPQRHLPNTTQQTKTAGEPRERYWCPGCSASLDARGCKLRCPRCGYFEDCSNLI